METLTNILDICILIGLAEFIISIILAILMVFTMIILEKTYEKLEKTCTFLLGTGLLIAGGCVISKLFIFGIIKIPG